MNVMNALIINRILIKKFSQNQKQLQQKPTKPNGKQTVGTEQ